MKRKGTFTDEKAYYIMSNHQKEMPGVYIVPQYYNGSLRKHINKMHSGKPYKGSNDGGISSFLTQNKAPEEPKSVMSQLSAAVGSFY